MIHFYCFFQTAKIVISDLPVEIIKKKYGYRYEILTSIKDKTSLEIIKTRLNRTYSNFTFEENLLKPKQPRSLEANKKTAEGLKGVPKTEEHKRAISLAKKGKSQFQGKKHSEETKARMSERKKGNKHTKDYYWAHDPRGDKELRVKDRNKLPEGFMLGRDYYSTEPGLYYFKSSTIPPKEI